LCCQMQMKQLEADLVELQDLLKEEQQKVEKELGLKKQQKEQQVKSQAEPCALQSPTHSPDHQLRCGALFASSFTSVFYTAWDQSENLVKINLTLKDVHENPPENVQVESREGCTFPKPHVSLQQIKRDMVLVMCKKQTSQKWECLTKVEQQTKEKKDSDPSQGLMNILKKIYSEGDDETKRTLNKAWTESQEKRRGDTMDF
uniref:Calcyclin binding protein n=1 Tax=Takifugu rubripes TaxID=31033 RepID=A0A674NPH9_TAKRU